MAITNTTTAHPEGQTAVTTVNNDSTPPRILWGSIWRPTPSRLGLQPDDDVINDCPLCRKLTKRESIYTADGIFTGAERLTCVPCAARGFLDSRGEYVWFRDVIVDSGLPENTEEDDLEVCRHCNQGGVEAQERMDGDVEHVCLFCRRVQ